MMRLPTIIYTISDILQEYNARAIVVGGSVRDHILHKHVKDYDIEVYGLNSMDELEQILSKFGTVNQVGKSFGVVKFTHDGEEYDFSFPRIEHKVGHGHRGFKIDIDGSLDFPTASRRRDLTMNALGFDVIDGAFVDPYGGIEDINNGIIRHIDDVTFIEDPLRIYRVVQFAARFEFDIDDATKKLCKTMISGGMLEELPKERIFEEFKKLLLRSSKPSVGFELMQELGVLKYFPELADIVDVPQSPKWHPEGDVWTHTMLCIDMMSKELSSCKYSEKDYLKFMFAILCHDFGKATHTAIEEDGRIRSIGHEKAGVEPARKFLYRLMNEHDFIESVLPLVEHHLKPSQFYRNNAKSKAIRKLATKVNIEELVLVARADFLGRTTDESMSGVYEAGDWMLSIAKDLKVHNRPLDRLLKGRDLIDLGLEPSKKFRDILESVYDKQLDGSLNSKKEALEYVCKYFV